MSHPSSVAQHTTSSQLPHPCLPCAVTVVLSIVIFIVTFVLCFCVRIASSLSALWNENAVRERYLSKPSFGELIMLPVLSIDLLHYHRQTIICERYCRCLLEVIIQIVPLLPWASFSFPATITIIYFLPEFNFCSLVISFTLSVSEYECDYHLHRNHALAICSCFTPVLFQWSSYSQLLPRTKGTHNQLVKVDKVVMSYRSKSLWACEFICNQTHTHTVI